MNALMINSRAFVTVTAKIHTCCTLAFVGKSGTGKDTSESPMNAGVTPRSGGCEGACALGAAKGQLWAGLLQQEGERAWKSLQRWRKFTVGGRRVCEAVYCQVQRDDDTSCVTHCGVCTVGSLQMGTLMQPNGVKLQSKAVLNGAPTHRDTAIILHNRDDDDNDDLLFAMR